MRHISLTLSLGALVAAGVVDDPAQQRADQTKREVVGEGPLAAHVQTPALARPDAVKSFVVGEAALEDLVLVETNQIRAGSLGGPIYEPDENPLGTVLSLPLDMQPISKGRIEDPLERAIEPIALPTPDQLVRAGLVNWHADLAAAQAASRRTGKPILLFQLLGRLDETFC